ncbi:MAG: bifunctional demethylmenaquinone methyltransferase/2-methoxy-6-polyprenyl-1,4-benzoquinol methylase UbiE [Rhodospirillaceae bacterium]|nr:bifunctional demethylmenaquinone methyltransferase/2-methoxy-6-polyprenyl-1,4-benzoquinol methylase UbiE [Rhodospirillaceae bacterium]
MDSQKKPKEFTDFGFEQVPIETKSMRVGDVFDSVADRYDLMNDLMSFGFHRAWKNFALSKTALKSGGVALDIAAGSGDLSKGIAKQVGSDGQVFVTDVNVRMLNLGRTSLTDAGYAGNIFYAQANAEKLPFDDSQFHCVTIGFGLRNVTDKLAALAEMYRVLKPGGRLLVLEFSKPKLGIFNSIYDIYSFKILPKLGHLVTKDSDSYRYLAESIRVHPDQDKLKELMEAEGFERCEYYNLSAGIVALHLGFKL